MDINKKLNKLFIEIFNKKIESDKDKKMLFNKFENYDSILHMKLFLYVEREFNISISEKDIFSSNNYQKLYKVIKLNIEN